MAATRRPPFIGASVETEEVVFDVHREPTQRGDWTLTLVAARTPELIGRTLVLPWTGCEIGRHPQGVRPPQALDDPTLSRSHVLLDPMGMGRGVQVQDCGSRNGVFVNGTKVLAAEVSHRSVLRLGHVLGVLSCGAPPCDWLGVRADLPQLADNLVPRPDQSRWIDAIGVLCWERLLLHQWRDDDSELRHVFQELVSYPLITEQGLGMLLSARVKAAEASRTWGLRRPSGEELQRLLGVYDGCVADVAGHLGVDRRQVYRWLEYDKRDREQAGSAKDSPGAKR